MAKMMFILTQGRFVARAITFSQEKHIFITYKLLVKMNLYRLKI